MATRAFTDRQGDGWKVWETVPQDARGCLPAYAKGWLTFEHAERGDRRRLAPIPDGWADASDERLQLMCRVAEPVRTGWRSTPPQGVPVVLDQDGPHSAAAADPA